MTGSILGPCVELPADVVARKIATARRAAEIWRRTSIGQRIDALTRVWESLNLRRAEGLAIIREEHGGSRLETEFLEFGSAAMLVDYFTHNARRILDDRAAWLPWYLFNKSATIRRLPRGIVGVITPWSVPFLVPFSDAFCAMLAGNAVLLKPSEWTTKTALWIETVAQATGALPEGLLSVISGAATAGEAVVDAADLVMFTGSSRTGAIVAARAAGRLTPCVLELGGKNSMIVCADAALERAAAAAVWGGLLNGGQSCVGVERVYVEARVYDAFLDQVKARFAELKTGNEACVVAARLVVASSVERLQAQLQDASRKGATVLGGHVLDPSSLRMAPALVFEATSDMRVMTEELFGPVLPVMKVERAEEAIALTNAGDTGLSASVWSADLSKAEKLASMLKVGMIGINEPGSHLAIGSLPFGGVKSSGYGRRHGDEGLLALTHAQSILVHEWPTQMIDPWWLPRRVWVIAWLRRQIGLR